MEKCKSIASVSERRRWRKSLQNWRDSSAVPSRRFSNRKKSSRTRNLVDTRKTRPGRAFQSLGLRQILERLFVFRGLAALICDHALHGWSPCRQTGAAPRFFCGSKLGFALFARHGRLVIVKF